MEMISEAFGGDGLIWMIAILVVSVFAMAVIIERFVFLFFRYNINADQFMESVRKMVRANSVDRAIKLCKAKPNAAVPRVVQAGLERANKGRDAIRVALEESRLAIEPEVKQRTKSLLVFANIATLLGLLGTIVGLIQAFAALEGANAEERQSKLAAGISTAMYTTAFGLIVAIPTLLSHMVLDGFTRKIIDEVDHYSVMLEDLLVYQQAGVDAAE